MGKDQGWQTIARKESECSLYGMPDPYVIGPQEGPAFQSNGDLKNTRSNANPAEELEYYFLLSSFLN